MLKSKVVLGFIIFIGFAVGYLYYSQTSETLTDTGGAPIDPNLLYFENAKFDFSVLDRPSYKDLEIYGEIPVNPGVTGRKNVFAPLQ